MGEAGSGGRQGGVHGVAHVANCGGPLGPAKEQVNSRCSGPKAQATAGRRLLRLRQARQLCLSLTTLPSVSTSQAMM